MIFEVLFCFDKSRADRLFHLGRTSLVQYTMPARQPCTSTVIRFGLSSHSLVCEWSQLSLGE